MKANILYKQIIKFSSQKQPPEVFFKKHVKNFAKFTGKHLRQGLLSQPKACNFVVSGRGVFM